MRLRTKTKKRMVLLLVAAVVAAGSVGTALVLGWEYRQKQNAAFKPQGMKAYEAGEYVKASDLLLTYLGRHSEDSEALDVYAKVRTKLAGDDGAQLAQIVNLYQRLITLKPEVAEYKSSLLNLDVQLGKYTEAGRLADEILGIKSSGTVGPATTAAASRPASTDLETLRMKAAAQMGLRNFAGAELTVNEALKTDPLATNAMLQLMLIRKNDGESEKLPALVEAHAKGRETDPRLPLLRTVANILAQHTEAAKSAARQALQMNPPSQEYAWGLIRSLDQLEMFPEARAYAQKAWEIFKDDNFQDDYYLRLTYAEEYEKVAAELAKPEAHAEKSTWLTALRVIALCELKKKDEAKPLLDVLHDRGERFDYLGNNWHDVLKEVYFTDPPKARSIIDMCTEAGARQPGNALFQLYLGDAYADVGDGNEAMLRWNASGMFAPAWSRPLVRLSRYAYLQGKALQALPLAQAAERRLPGVRDTEVALAVAWSGAMGQPGVGDKAELLAKIEEIQKKFPDEETTLPLQVALLMGTGRKSAAEARVKAVVESTPPPTEQTLLAMSNTCSALKLGQGTELAELCLQKSEKLHGLTPRLATGRARLLISAGKQAEARQMMESARNAAKGDADAWGIAWCQLLEVIRDPDVLAAWKKLEASALENTMVLWAVLGANSARQDHAFTGEVLERLKTNVGEGGLTWRLEKAQWLLEDPKSHENQDATLKLLIDTVQSSPQSGRAHELLARAYENSGNLSQAESQLMASVDLDPVSVGPKLLLARILLLQNKSIAAQQYLKQVAQADYATDAEKLNAGMMLAQTGEMDTSTQVIEQAAASDTTGRAQWYLAGLHWRRGEMDKAEAIYASMLKKPSVEIITTASNFYLARGKPESADKALALLGTLKLAPGEQDRILGLSYAMRNDTENAIKYLSSSTDAAPDSAETWRRLISMQIAAKRPADVIASAEKGKKALAGDETCAALLGPSANVLRLLEDADTRGYFMSCLMSPEKNKGAAEVVAALANVHISEPAPYAAAIRRIANDYQESMALQVLTIRKLMQSDQIEDALALAKRAGKMDTASPLPPLYESVCDAMLGRWTEALGAADTWRNAIPSDPMNADMVRAVGLIGLNREDEAIKLLADYQKRTNMDPTALRSLVSLMAEAKMQQKQPGSAEDAAAGMWPYVKDAAWRAQWCKLAAMMVPDVAHAQEWLVRLRSATPEDAYREQVNIGIAWHIMGVRLNDGDSKKEGVRILTDLAASRAADTNLVCDISLTLGPICEADGEDDQAEMNYRRAMKLSPSRLDVANNLAMLLARRGTKLDEAEALAQRAADGAVAGDPIGAAYWDTLGYVLSKTQKIDQSQTAYKKAISLQPREPIWRIDLADMLLSAGQRDLAQESFHIADTLRPEQSKMPGDVWLRYMKLKATFGKACRDAKFSVSAAEKFTGAGRFLMRNGVEPLVMRKVEEASSAEVGGGTEFAALRVALVHDFLYCYAGAERVLAEMIEVFPQADVFSLIDFLPAEERHFLKGKKVRTSFLQKMPLAKQKHRSYLPLMPLAIENLDLSGYDLVISSSYLSAKGVITAPHQLHICYCHSPARFAWDQQHQYLEQSGLEHGIRGFLAKMILHYIRAWDVRGANGVDMFLSNSQFVRQRIEKTYRRDATPIYPPVDVNRFAMRAEKEDYYVTTSRMVPYKRVDLIVEAFTRMPQRRLVVIGDGPDFAKVRRLAGPNVAMLGHQSHEVMSGHLQKARGFVFAAEEDFGMAPVEAQACGTPVIAFGRGGVTESVISGKTGIFFPRQTADDLIQAVEKFEQMTWDAGAIRKHAENFSKEEFRRSFKFEVERAWTLFQNRRGQMTGEMARQHDGGRRDGVKQAIG